MLPHGAKRRLKRRSESEQARRQGLLRSLCFFCAFEFGQGSFPSLLQFSRHQAIVRINPIELTPCYGPFIAQTFEVLLMGMCNVLGGGLLGGDCSCVDISFHRREHLEKALHHLQINWVCRNRSEERRVGRECMCWCGKEVVDSGG